MTKETATNIKEIASARKAYREHLINLVFDLIDSALNRHKNESGTIFTDNMVILMENKVRGKNMTSVDVNVADHIVYDKEAHEIQVMGESAEGENIVIGNFSTMPIGMVEAVVNAIIKTAKSE